MRCKVAPGRLRPRTIEVASPLVHHATRFLREMRVVAGLDHPHIVAAFDAGMCPAFQLGDPDLYYFAMEMLKGQDLEQFVHSAKPSVSQVCALIYQIAAALDEAQRHQLVHRDIKPSNIFVTDKGQAKLLDFGLVRHMLGHDYTKPNVVVGSLDYMAPEQAFDPTKVDTRTDIFSLGAVLFFALTGSSPFPHKGNLMESVMRRRDQQPLSARQLRPDLPAALENVLTQMLALRPEERMASPQDVMHALLPYLDQGGPVRMGTRGQPRHSRLLCRRRPAERPLGARVDRHRSARAAQPIRPRPRGGRRGKHRMPRCRQRGRPVA